MRPFVATIVSADTALETACVTIDQVVFEPKHLTAMLANCSLPTEYGHDWSIIATTKQEAKTLLEATLSDWIDFIFIPTPKPFVMYANHDEYTTFYANTRSNLNRVADALSMKGFERVENYERKL